LESSSVDCILLKILGLYNLLSFLNGYLIKYYAIYSILFLEKRVAMCDIILYYFNIEND
jgi:hypothetical protein